MSLDLIHIRSVDRTLGTTASSFRVLMPTLLSQKTRVVLIDAQIPYSMYTVPSSSASMVVTVSGTPTTVSITPGNYTPASLCTAVNAATTALGTLTYSTVTNVISGNAPSSLSLAGGLATVLGAGAAGTASISAGAFSFSGIPQLSPYQSLFIKFANLSGVQSSTSGASYHFRCQLEGGPGLVSFYNKSSTSSQFAMPATDVGYLDVVVTDTSGNTINFNGGEIELSVAFG